MHTLNEPELAEAKRLLQSDSPIIAKAGARILIRSATPEAVAALRRRLLDPYAPVQVVAAICAALSWPPSPFEVDERVAIHLYRLWERHGHPGIADLIEGAAEYLDPARLLRQLEDEHLHDSALRLLVVGRSRSAHDPAAEWLFQTDDRLISLAEFAGIRHEQVPAALLSLLRHRQQEGRTVDAGDFASAFGLLLPDAHALRGLHELAYADSLEGRVGALRVLVGAGFLSAKIVESLLAQLPN